MVALIDSLSALGKDVAGYAVGRTLETQLAPSRSPLGPTGGEPLGADAQQNQNQSAPDNPGWRDTPDGYFGTKKKVEGNSAVVDASKLTPTPTPGLMWAMVGLVVVLLGLRFLRKK